MSGGPDEGQELRSESEQVRAQLREHVGRLAAVVAELRAMADVPQPVQQEAEHPRTSGAPDHE